MEEENKDKPKGQVKTYQDAISEALRTQSMSSSGMLMAEQKKRDDFKAESESRSISNPKNKLLMALAIVLIISSVGIIAFAIIKANNRQPQDNTGFIMKSKYFISEKIIEVASSQLARNTLARVQQASTEPLEKNDVAHLVLTKEVKADPSSSFDFRVKTPYNTDDFLNLITARTPENIRKVLDPEFLLGVHKATQNETFVLFRVTNYENAYAGMLTWESALARDMEGIFPEEIDRARITKIEEIVPDTIISTSTTKTSTTTTTTSTSTTTPEVQRTIDNTRVWHDRVIKNTDARALLNEAGQIVFFYAIIDKEYIFFGANQETFAEVMRRVRTAKLIR